jgi:molybdate transport system substrate-binding protein
MNKLLTLLTAIVVISSSLYAKENKTMLFYCGITMVKPMQEIANNFEKKYNCKIKIIQGGSQDLYNALKLSKKGDFYLPGSDSYLKKNEKDGFFEERVYVGYNQVAIFVKKGNPKNITSLEDFTNEEYASVICNPKSGSIGRMSKKILTKYKGEDYFYDVFDMAAEIGTDSRSLNNSLQKPQIDMTLNWKATAYFDKNIENITVVEIDEKYSQKKKLVLTQLSFSKNKELAKKFLVYAGSDEGTTIMKKYGFR